MKKLLLILVLTLFFTNSYAQTPKDQIKTFFKTYEDKGFDKAIDDLFLTNKWIADIKSSQDNIKFQFSSLGALLGNYYGYELLTAQRTGTCYEYYTYLVKYERQPIRFHFSFYEVNGKWIFQNFKYEDKFASTMEESALINCIVDIIDEE
ncbi:MAG: hypothetical protein QM660_08980 [Dysgonomonas sp.]